MKNRWLNLLFLLLCILIGGLSYHLFVTAKTKEAASLIINILKPLNILLFLVLFYVLFRHLFRLFMDRRAGKSGLRLQNKLVFGILPLTLVPSIFLFLLATRFVDDMLMDLVFDSTENRIVQSAEALRTEYLTEIGAMQARHAPSLFGLHDNDLDAEIRPYLDRYGLQAVEFMEPDLPPARFLSSSFPVHRAPRLAKSLELETGEEPVLFDDGFLVVRFTVRDGSRSLRFIFTRETPFTERFAYIRDSFIYLNHTIKKTEKIKGLNQGIMLVATLGVLFGGVWTGIAFARRFLSAFHVLIAGAEQVSKGNLDTQLELKTGDEIDDVIQAFNSMTRTLKSNRQEIEQKATDLEEVNTALSGQIEYSHTILRNVGTGILSTDEDGRIRTFNPAAEEILGLGAIADNSLFRDLAEAHQGLLDQWTHFRKKEGQDLSRQLELLLEGETRYITCSMTALNKEGDRFGSLIVLEDLTQLLNAQKLAAWQEVARRVAHEIKNPLTPIQLSIQRIRRKAQKGAPDLVQAIESAHETIMSETDLLKNLVNEFSTFAKMPAPVKTETDLKDIVESVCESYQPAIPHIKLVPQTESSPLFCDPSQMRQVISNLIQNAANASERGSEVRVSVRRESRHILLQVTDWGKGIPEQERDRVFVPYYSKSPKGTGLGLAIVKRIVEDHGGSITIESNQPRGVQFLILLPQQAQSQELNGSENGSGSKHNA